MTIKPPLKKATTSITRRALKRIALGVTAVTLVVSGVIYLQLRVTIRAETEVQLHDYLVQRIARERLLFSQAVANTTEFKSELTRALTTPPPADLDARFARIAKVAPDGTLRSEDGLDFKRDGQIFAGPQTRIDARTKHLYVAAYDLTVHLGRAWHTQYQDTYVTTPDNGMILFWPEIPDWGRTCKTDLDMTKEPYIAYGDPAQNPTREPRWTPLYFDKVSKVWMSSLVHPVDIAGIHVANVSHDILLNDLIERTVVDSIPGAHNVILRKDGRLIVHPNFITQIQDAGGDFLASSARSTELDGVLSLIQHTTTDTHVQPSADDEFLLAVGFIAGPDWYVAVVYPTALVDARAIAAARLVLVFGGGALIVQLLLMAWVLRREIATPLAALTTATERLASGEFSTRVQTSHDDEIGLLASSFNRMTQAIGDRDAALGEHAASLERLANIKASFLANMSHEIRTPMNAIMGMVELCLERDPPEVQRRYLTKVYTALQHLLRILNDVLDFSKIDAGKLDVEAIPFTLDAVIDQLRTLMSKPAADKGIVLVIEVAAEVPAHLVGDATRLGQVLLNLVSNALKFSPAGEVRVRIGAERHANERVTLAIAVSDHGIGLTPGALAALFTPFTQADESTSRRFGGTGLGLAISKRLVELMGGTIGATSELGVGSTFHFTIDVGVTQASVAPERAEVPSLASIRGAHVLVVDDVELNRELISDLLADSGVHVHVACNGREAIEAIAASRPDCVLMDCQMPELDGLAATRVLRRDPRYLDLPIIAVSANATVEDRARSAAAGMNAHLAKPFRLAELCDFLVRWIEPTRTPTSTLPAPMPAPSSTGVAPSLPTLPGFDTSLGLAQVGHQLQLYRKVLGKFRDQLERFEIELPPLVARSDWRAAGRLAHSIKGTARQLGAGTLGERAEELERGLHGEHDAIAVRLDNLLRELAHIRPGLEAMA